MRDSTTDYRRWLDPTSYDDSWECRTERAAQLVSAGHRVIEFGAGTRKLERYLDPSCTYVPSDLTDRGPGTIVCDLNSRPLPTLPDYDTAVLLGVLEYLRDVPEIIGWLASQVQFCVVSYVCRSAGSISGVLEVLRRNRAGWMNHYSEAQIVELFREQGFEKVSVETCSGNRLFVFANPAKARRDPERGLDIAL
ncbi:MULTISPECIES: class I SAM-dependent methyltransferase [Mycobacterium avium complex (MAC)]|uniref:Methyltransferase n=1 Tax=Mycobacterium timonense TaxID=701043 RepID=A0ABX3TEL9_9MYCO|nr:MULTISPECIES: class I SAM-dependent methyltransferase [Mycobacterium avium complex (MAC)]ETB33475.1 hypothetical protein N602_29670 [Mycobacterium avium subsp. hominissuis 10-5606]ORB77251.1 hypothetical protein BST46_25565 [Mycobacterium timonense]